MPSEHLHALIDLVYHPGDLSGLHHVGKAIRQNKIIYNFISKRKHNFSKSKKIKKKFNFPLTTWANINVSLFEFWLKVFNFDSDSNSESIAKDTTFLYNKQPKIMDRNIIFFNYGFRNIGQHYFKWMSILMLYNLLLKQATQWESLFNVNCWKRTCKNNYQTH